MDDVMFSWCSTNFSFLPRQHTRETHGQGCSFYSYYCLHIFAKATELGKMIGESAPQKQQWTPSSWRKHPIKQQPEYPDPKKLESALQKVAQIAGFCRWHLFSDQTFLKISPGPKPSTTRSSQRSCDSESQFGWRLQRQDVHPTSIKLTCTVIISGSQLSLQGGDCAERFLDCNRRAIESKFCILLQMSLILTYCARVPVVKIGR